MKNKNKYFIKGKIFRITNSTLSFENNTRTTNNSKIILTLGEVLGVEIDYQNVAKLIDLF